MKLTPELPSLTLLEKLEEFNTWVTPSLGEIKETERFQEEMTRICGVIEAVGAVEGNFAERKTFTVERIGDAILSFIKALPVEQKVEGMVAAASFLFLATGKSDNNAKCQFPIYLRHSANQSTFPKITESNGKITVKMAACPSVIKSDKVAQTVIGLKNDPQEQAKLVGQYVNFILSDEASVNSLWAIGHTYFNLKSLNHTEEQSHEKDFLTPLILFQIRGSVTASGGHAPENLLRDLMKQWGLMESVDYNVTDVIIGRETEQTESKAKSKTKTKTRAYDFVLPYQLVGFPRTFFIQCQFYAGDSGSVSHKNVDQTSAARSYTATKVASPLFVEYVDGAGYCGSLSSDLQSILSFDSTFNFFQVRTAPLKLRKMLQDCGYLTPLEVVHAAVSYSGDISNATAYLTRSGYSESEILRASSQAKEVGILLEQAGKWDVATSYRDVARRYFLLDSIANRGGHLEVPVPSGAVMVPGFGSRYGITPAGLADVTNAPGGFNADWSDGAVLEADIQWLLQNKWVIRVGAV